MTTSSKFKTPPDVTSYGKFKTPPDMTSQGQFKTPPEVPQSPALMPLTPLTSLLSPLDLKTPQTTERTPMPAEWSDFTEPARTPLVAGGSIDTPATASSAKVKEEVTPPGRPQQTISKLQLF